MDTGSPPGHRLVDESFGPGWSGSCRPTVTWRLSGRPPR